MQTRKGDGVIASSVGRPRSSPKGIRYLVVLVVAALLGAVSLLGAQPVSAKVGAITQFRIPTSNSGPGAITKGPDGALWFAECFGPKIGRSTATGQ